MIKRLLSILLTTATYYADCQDLTEVAKINIADFNGNNGILIDHYIFSVDNYSTDDKYAVIDIANPSSPRTVLVNSFGFDFEPHSMILDGTKLYIGSSVSAGDDKTLVVMDVSNPEAPTILNSYLTFPYDGKNFKVTGIRQKVGNYLFCAAGTFNLMTLDVTDPSNIFIVDGFGDGFTGTILSGIDNLELIDANNAWLDNNDLRHVAIGSDGTFTVGDKQPVTGELYDMQFNQAGTLGFAVSWQVSASNLITLNVSGQTATESNVLDIHDITGGFGFGADAFYLEDKNILLIRDVVSFYAFDVSNPASPQYLESYTGEGKIVRQGERILVDGGSTADYILYSFGDEGNTNELSANFTASETTVAPGGSATYTFSGTGTPTTYAWTFEGGTPATSTAASPVVTYATAGQFDVTLEVSGEGGASDTETKVDYISVTDATSATASLVSYYSFEASSLDDKKGNNDLISVGGSFAAGVDEVANSAYKLGKNDHLKMPPALLDGKTDFSISLWTKISSLNGSTADPLHSILSAANATKDNEVLFKYEPPGASLCPDNSLSVTYRGELGPAGSNDPNCAGLSDTFNPLEWHHLVLAKSGGTTKIYLDKVEVASFTHNATALDVEGLVIGQDQDALLGGFNPDQSLNGLVDEIYLFDGAITTTQVDSLYSLKGTTGGGSSGGADVSKITELWAKHIPVEGNDEIVDIAVDSNGTIYATGYASRTVDDSRVTDVVVTSADKDGNEKYFKTVVNNGGWTKPEDEPWTIAVDDSGNAYVAAGLDRYLGGVSGSIAMEHNLLSFDAQGTERWRVMTDTKHDYSQYMTVWGDKVTLLINGDAPTGAGTSIAHAISYSAASGSVLSNTTVDMGQGNIAIGRYVDMYGFFRTERRLIQHNGNVIFGVTHAGTGANGRDIQLRSVSSTGQVLSAKIDSDRSMSQDELISLLADQNNNIYVLARLADADHTSIMSLLKFNAQLGQLWRVDVVPEGSSIGVSSMSFDSDGNLIISGTETQPRLAKVSADGELLWSKHYKDLDIAFTQSYSVYVSANDKIILAGSGGVSSGIMSFVFLDKDGNITETYQNDYENGEFENFINKTVYVPEENAVYVGGWARDDNNDKSLYYGKYAFPSKSGQTITFEELEDVAQGASPITLAAVASSGLPVTYLVTGPATINGSVLTITGAGLVTVTARQAGNSGYSAAADVIQTFCVLASKPNVTAAEQADGVLLTSSVAAGNQWYKDGEPIDGAIEKTYLAIASGDYEVRVLIDGCEGALSDVEEVEVSPVLGLSDFSEKPEISVYPNPVAERLVVDAGAVAIQSVGLFTISGRILRDIEMTKPDSGTIEIDTEKLPAGMYILKLASVEGDYNIRIVRK